MASIWQITNLERISEHDELTNVVSNIHWFVSDIDADGWFAYSFGNAILDIDNIDPDSFVDFSTLSEADVITWLKNWMGQDGVDRIEQELQVGIANRDHTERRMGVPW